MRGRGCAPWAVAFVLISAGALCAEMPSFDSQRFCDQSSNVFTGMKETMQKSCLEEEKKREAQVRRVLPMISDQTAEGCKTVASALYGGSFQGFAGCVALSLANDILEGKIKAVRDASR